MLEAGLFEGKRVELLDGEIIDMSAMKDLHAVAVGTVGRALDRAFPGCWARPSLPLSFLSDSEPEPDFAVVPGEPRDYKGRDAHPDTAMLVVEIADTSLRFDRGVMAEIYARAGIQDYWIVNLVDDCVEVLRDPQADAEAPLGFQYRSKQTFARGQEIVPLAQSNAAGHETSLLLRVA